MPRNFSLPRALLHLEGLVVAVAAVAFYANRGGGWLLFAALILAPDLGLLGFLAGPRVGSITYDVLHFYALPAALAAYGLLTNQPLPVNLALIWFTHIGADRLLGFGLRYPAGSKESHLTRV